MRPLVWNHALEPDGITVGVHLKTMILSSPLIDRSQQFCPGVRLPTLLDLCRSCACVFGCSEAVTAVALSSLPPDS